MPAAAVASRTPSMAGSCGTDFGARGETAVAMEKTKREGAGVRPARVLKGSCAAALLLRRVAGGRRRHGGRGRQGGRGRRVVEALDLRGLAQLADIVRLGAPYQERVELLLDGIELGYRPLALVLELDDVPAELGL